jgi:hypothetical protein
LLKFKGKWDDDKIDEAIANASSSKTQGKLETQAKTPTKYIEVYELRGELPESWLKEDGNPHIYTNQLHIVCLNVDNSDKKEGYTLYKGKDKPINETFKALVISPVFGRACGKSIIESLFDPQVWVNFSEIKIKALLESAVNLFQTESEEIAGQKLSELANNTILKHEQGKPITRVDGTLQNLPQLNNYQTTHENNARIIGSASDPQLGSNPVSGTPFALQNVVIQQGQGIHEYRQGKIATFFSDVLYRDWILKMLVKEMNEGQTFSEVLTLDELQEIAEMVVSHEVEEKISNKILETGVVPTEEERQLMISTMKEEFFKSGSRKFFEIFKDELKDIPVDVYVNIKGKQRYMAQNADKITNIIREFTRNQQAIAQIPGIGKAYNQLLEESGMSPIDFAPMVKAEQTQEVTPSAMQDITSSVGGEQLADNKQ